jgi:phage-related protein
VLSLTGVVRYDNLIGRRPRGDKTIIPRTRSVSWVKAALKDFETFPEGARSICLAALTIAAEGGKADIVKPMRGLGAGVFEVALPFRGNAFRVVYAVQLADDIWVVHAFQKKSTQGIKTPTHEVDLIKDRLKRLKEMLQ